MATVQARAPLILIMDCVGALVIFLFFLARIPVVCDSISVQILHTHTHMDQNTHMYTTTKTGHGRVYITFCEVRELSMSIDKGFSL